jgi:hypothetical protein
MCVPTRNHTATFPSLLHNTVPPHSFASNTSTEHHLTSGTSLYFTGRQLSARLSPFSSPPFDRRRPTEPYAFVRRNPTESKDISPGCDIPFQGRDRSYHLNHRNSKSLNQRPDGPSSCSFAPFLALFPSWNLVPLGFLQCLPHNPLLHRRYSVSNGPWSRRHFF